MIRLEEIKDELQEVKQSIAAISENLQRIESLLQGIMLTGKVDLDNAEIFMHITAWNRAVGEMQLIKGALSQLK